MKNRGKKELRSFLISLVQDGVVGVKAGTEVEFFGQLEIEIFQEIVNGVLPIIVKIGGVDAREDIYTLLTMDVDGIIVPMIESEYALKNFFLAYDYIKNAIRKEFSIISINIETIESYKNIDKIFRTSYFKRVDRVVVGRKDLSLSMGKDSDSKQVLEVAKDIVIRANRYGKETSIGGGISTKAVEVIKEIESDFINTRHIIIKREAVNKRLIERIIEFEMSFYKYLLAVNPFKEFFYLDYIKSLGERL